jgi:hypothetical protein
MEAERTRRGVPIGSVSAAAVATVIGFIDPDCIWMGWILGLELGS